MRPVLRPGAALLRRDAAHVQVGLEPGRAVVVRDSPLLRALVASADGVRDAAAVVEAVVRSAAGTRTEAVRTLRALTAAQVLVDAEVIRAAPCPDEAAHRLARGTPSRPGDRIGPAPQVAVHGTGPLADRVAGLLDGVLGERSRAGRRPGERPDVVVLAGSVAGGAAADALVAEGVPHLALAVVDGTAVLGPFVLPGRTACLRCVDAARAGLDPGWRALVAQLPVVALAAHGLPAPRSRVLETVLSGWAVREVLAHLDGGRVVTYGATVRFDDDLRDQERHGWALHPSCGCALLI